MVIKIFLFLSVVIYLLYKRGKLEKFEINFKSYFDKNTKNMNANKKKNMMYFYKACGLVILYLASNLIASVLESKDCKDARLAASVGFVNQAMVDCICDNKCAGKMHNF